MEIGINTLNKVEKCLSKLTDGKIKCYAKTTLDDSLIKAKSNSPKFKKSKLKQLKIFSENESIKLKKIHEIKIKALSVYEQVGKAWAYSVAFKKTGLLPTELALKKEAIMNFNNYYMIPKIAEIKEAVTTLLQEHTKYVPKKGKPHFKAFNHKSFQFFN